MWCNLISESLASWGVAQWGGELWALEVRSVADPKMGFHASHLPGSALRQPHIERGISRVFPTLNVTAQVFPCLSSSIAVAFPSIREARENTVQTLILAQREWRP